MSSQPITVVGLLSALTGLFSCGPCSNPLSDVDCDPCAEFAISPPSARLQVRAQIQFTARCIRMSHGITAPASSPTRPAWFTSDPAVVTVADGLATALAPGTAELRAVVQNVSAGNATVTVVAEDVAPTDATASRDR